LRAGARGLADAPFGLGDTVSHPALGTGVVQRVTEGTVRVLFEDAGHETLDAKIVEQKGLLALASCAPARRRSQRGMLRYRRHRTREEQMAATPAKNEDLHGNAPDKSPVALLMIDLINDFEFPGGESLFEQTLSMTPRLRDLKRRAKAHDVPVVYVNDNFGRWQSDQRKLIEHTLADGGRGRPVAEQLLPDDDDYFVLKPKHSGF